jgi:hypothetical protein
MAIGLDHLGSILYNLHVGTELHTKHENVESEKSIIFEMSTSESSHPKTLPCLVLMVSNKEGKLEGHLNVDGVKELIDTYVSCFPVILGMLTRGDVDLTITDQQLKRQ